jgi:effector-binding domain-containing protein
MNKLQVSYSKTLKLQNVLIIEGLFEDEKTFSKNVLMMENYIKAKGGMPVGPLIQYTCPGLTEDGQLNVDIKLLRQATTFIKSIEKPYSMESVIRVPNCLYLRYHGPEEKLQFAYQKLNLVAFEENINLKGDSYTVFVNTQDGIITADIFMERADNE